MPVTIYLKSHPAWPLLGSLVGDKFYVGDRVVHASLIERHEKCRVVGCRAKERCLWPQDCQATVR